MSRRASPIHDPRQGSLLPDEPLFPPPVPPPAMAGAANIGRALRAALSQAMELCPYSRAEIAARMTEALFAAGEEGEVTLSQLNAWTAPSRGDWRFPLEYLPALVEATGAVWLVDWLAQRCGCRALRGEQAVLVEMSAKEVLARKAAAEAKRLQREVAALKEQVTPDMLRGLGGPEAAP